MRRFGFLTLLLPVLALAVAAVRYDVGPAISLSYKVNTRTVAPGQAVLISAQASDTDAEEGANGVFTATVSDPVTITCEATAGKLNRQSVTNNPGDFLWYSPSRPGTYAVFITARDSGRFGEDPPARAIISLSVSMTGERLLPNVRVSATPAVIDLRKGRRTTVRAQLMGDRVGDRDVQLFATAGRLSATQVRTDAAGVATAQLTVDDADEGVIQVAAYYGDTTATTTVTVVRQDYDNLPLPPYLPPTIPGANPAGFFLEVVPSTLPADGMSTAAVRLRVADMRGASIPRTVVTFVSTAGIVAPRHTLTDLYGYALARLTAPEQPGTGYVVAVVGNQRAYAPITFQPLEQAENAGPARVYLTVDPTSALADAASRVRVEALVLDGNNRAIENATVAFTTSLGTLQATTLRTDRNGRAETVLIAPDRPGQAVVSARYEDITAAGQVTFDGNAGGAGLTIASWSGQQAQFVAENWIYQQRHLDNAPRTAVKRELQMLTPNGGVTRTIDLGADGVVIRDQTGLARGCVLEDNEKARILLLAADGQPVRTVTLPLTLGSHVRDARCAIPAGNLLLSVSQPDGTRPEVYLFGAADMPLLTLKDGLEMLPVMALGGDGYLVMALPGGTVRLYTPTGAKVAEARRQDALPVTAVAVGAGGEWFAVASGTADAGAAARVSAFTRQSLAPFASFPLAALQLEPVSRGALVAGNTERTVMLNLVTRRMDWSVPGGFERFLVIGDLGISAGRVNPLGGSDTRARITAIELATGKVVLTQVTNLGAISALLPPDVRGYPGVVADLYSLRFVLPK